MENMIILIQQLLVMAIYCMIGYIFHKRKLVSKEGCADLSNFLIYAILPCVIISSFIREQTAETTKKLFISLIVAAGLLFLSIIISHIFFRKNAVNEFSCSFSNAGFMGVPLISSILGSDAVFLIAGFIAMLNIMQWVYGVTLLMPYNKSKPFESLKNPLVISLLIGIVIYFLPFQCPVVIDTTIFLITKCNSPIAMFILGYYIAELPLKDTLFNKAAVPVSFVRLLLIPMLSLAGLLCIPSLSFDFKLALLIAASCPVGINVAIYTNRAKGDYHRAVITVCQSTVLSLISLPLMLFIATKLL